jgi:hypothetical protein
MAGMSTEGRGQGPLTQRRLLVLDPPTRKSTSGLRSGSSGGCD